MASSMRAEYVKMKFPDNMAPCVSIAGFDLEADKDGCVEIPKTHVDTLKSHGFVVAPVAPPAPPKK